jgi:hypothetical protein
MPRRSLDPIIQNLAKIPDELALKIIDDLWVWTAMELLVANHPRVNDLLLAHEQCKSLLGDNAKTQAKTRERLRSYFDLEASIPILHFHPVDQMNRVYSTTTLATSRYRSRGWTSFLHEVLTPDMNGHIYETLHNWPKLDLNQYAVKPIPPIDVFSSVERFTEHWEALQLAKENLVDQCASQLRCAAILLEENPDILKRTLDPEQKRRANTGHIVSRLRSDIGRLFRTHKVHPFAKLEFFRYELFPIIPFDEALAKLLNWAEEFGIVAGDQLCNPESRHSPSIMETARVVVDDMPFFYQSLPVGHAEMAREAITNERDEGIRTVKTPLSTEPASWVQEVDSPAITLHKPGNPSTCRLNAGLKGYGPFDKEKEQWLVSFVEFYRYLEALKSSQID